MDPVHTMIEQERLAKWEDVAGFDALRRVDRLLGAEGASMSALGARNAALLQLHVRLFGSAWPLRSDCPACRETCEFAIDAAQLAAELQPNSAPAPEYALHCADGCVRFRLPETGDLRALAALAVDPACTADELCQVLLERCVFDPCAHALSEQQRLALSAQMQVLDPAAMMSFDVTCPACAHAYCAPFDVAGALWSELQAAAERTLLEVDALARVYGWSEPEILALSPIRRLAYLQLVGAA